MAFKELFDYAVDFVATLPGECPELYGITDGKAIGTYIEKRFGDFLKSKVPDIRLGSSSSGLDIPDQRFFCDVKVTSNRKPQSSCSYQDTRQKIYGLGYNLLVFLYTKVDAGGACFFVVENILGIPSTRTADYALTSVLSEMVRKHATHNEIVRVLVDENLPGSDEDMAKLADEILRNPPLVGAMTISNAMQWRLHYAKALSGSILTDEVMRFGKSEEKDGRLADSL